MNLECRAHGSRHYRTGTQSLSLHYEAEGRGSGWAFFGGGEGGDVQGSL